MNEMRDAAMMTLADLVGFPTVTDESNLDLIEYARAMLEPIASDIRITHDENAFKANLLATIGPNVDGGVILSGHSDVVPAEDFDWTGPPFIATRRDQKVFGRGTADMKGFIACALVMAPVFARANLTRPVHIAITFDEEVGCRGAPILIDDLVRIGPKPAVAIVGEPTEMGIVTSHKGCYEYTTYLTGIEGHGSVPSLGVNAVQYGALYVSRLLELGALLEKNDPGTSPYDPPHTTISVGTMNGGTARNVIAGECVIQWEMRPVRNADARFVLEDLREFEEILSAYRRRLSVDAAIVTVSEGAVDGLEDTDQDPAFDLVSSLLGTSERHVAAFGTEAGLYQIAGIPAVVCGPGSIEVAHRPDEHISLDQLESCLEMMKGLTGKLSDE
ncbi:acetylornithine deacetylase [soil metagenome]